MSKRSSGRSAGSPHDQLHWSEVLDGRLSKLATQSARGEGQGAELRIRGKLSELFDAPGAPVFSDKPPSDAADALAELVCDALLTATRAGVTLVFEADGKVHRLDAQTSQRDLGRIESDLARALQTSRQAMAAAASRDVSSFSGNANAPSWLGAASGTAQDGRPIYEQGRAFNPEIARAIWAAFDRYIEGDSLEQVASYLNDQGYQTPGVSPLPLGDGRKVHPWKAQMVDFQISSLSAIGLRSGAQLELQAAQPPTPQRPALLSWPTFHLVQDLRSTPLGGGRPEAEHLLSGRVFCRRCKQEGHDLQPMNPASRSGGRTLVCQRKGAEHPGPLYEDFEAQLLEWLETQEHISPELDHLLAATEEELRQSMETFSWPPPRPESPQSLEEAIRAREGTVRADRTVGIRAKVDSFLAKLDSEPMSSGRAALRRKMRNVLRRHIARVFVSAVEAQTKKGTPKHNPIEEITVDTRNAITLFSSRDSVFNRQGGLKSDARLFQVVLQRIGHAHPDPEFVLALSVRRFELPPETDWEQILLSPSGDDRNESPHQEPIELAPYPEDVGGTLAGGTAGGESASINPSTPGLGDVSSTATLAPPATSLANSSGAEDEWTGYQPHSNSTSSRPWGVHIDAKDLDDLGDQFLELLVGQLPARDACNQADHLAFGMLLSLLEFFARFDAWLIEILRSAFDGQEASEIHRLIYQAICPASRGSLDVSSLDWRDGERHDLGRVLINNRPGSEQVLCGVFNGMFKGTRQSLRLATSVAAALEGLRWARDANGVLIRNPNLAAMAESVLRKSRPKEYFAAHPVCLYFQHPSAWQWLAARIRRRITRGSHSKTDGRQRTWRYGELREAFQAQHFPPCGLGSRPARVYLHGNGRVARRLRSALGI